MGDRPPPVEERVWHQSAVAEGWPRALLESIAAILEPGCVVMKTEDEIRVCFPIERREVYGFPRDPSKHAWYRKEDEHGQPVLAPKQTSIRRPKVSPHAEERFSAQTAERTTPDVPSPSVCAQLSLF